VLLSLHDLDVDGFLTIPELEAVYGLHHNYAKKDTPDAHMEAKRKVIIEKVLKQLDKNQDGRSPPQAIVPTKPRRLIHRYRHRVERRVHRRWRGRPAVLRFISGSRASLR
jgi:hypothetical protein